MTMITLSMQKGREKIAELKLFNLMKAHEMKDVDILEHTGKKKHYHIIAENLDSVLSGLEKWPGHIRKDIITEAQAEWMKQTHSPSAFN